MERIKYQKSRFIETCLKEAITAIISIFEMCQASTPLSRINNQESGINNQ